MNTEKHMAAHKPDFVLSGVDFLKLGIIHGIGNIDRFARGIHLAQYGVHRGASRFWDM